LYFNPLPQGHGSFRDTLIVLRYQQELPGGPSRFEKAMGLGGFGQRRLAEDPDG
jgi:hypothetical protein